MPKILNNISGSNVIAIYTYEGSMTPMFGILKEVDGEEIHETFTGEDTAKFLNNNISNGQRVISEALEEAIVHSLNGAVQLVGGNYSYIPGLLQNSESKRVTATAQQRCYSYWLERPASRQLPIKEEDSALITHLNKFRAYPKYNEINLTLADLCKYISPRLNDLFNELNLREKIKALSPEEKFIIVSLGCGYAPEVYVLYEHLGNELFNRIDFFGIDSYYPPDICLDSDDPEVEKYNVITIAKKCFTFPNVHFELADASQSKEVARLLPDNRLANFVIMRHPQIANTRLISYPFIKMIRETIPEISAKDTLCLVTTYFEAEYKKVCETFKSCAENFEEVPSNLKAVRRSKPLFRASDGEGFYSDTYAYVSRNKKQHDLRIMDGSRAEDGCPSIDSSDTNDKRQAVFDILDYISAAVALENIRLQNKNSEPSFFTSINPKVLQIEEALSRTKVYFHSPEAITALNAGNNVDILNSMLDFEGQGKSSLRSLLPTLFDEVNKMKKSAFLSADEYYPSPAI